MTSSVYNEEDCLKLEINILQLPYWTISGNHSCWRINQNVTMVKVWKQVRLKKILWSEKILHNFSRKIRVKYFGSKNVTVKKLWHRKLWTKNICINANFKQKEYLVYKTFSQKCLILRKNSIQKDYGPLNLGTQYRGPYIFQTPFRPIPDAFSYLPYTFHTTSRHLPDAFMVLFRHLFYTSGTFQKHFRHPLDTFLPSFSHLHLTFQTLSRHLPDTIQAASMYLPDTFLVLFRHLPRTF